MECSPLADVKQRGPKRVLPSSMGTFRGLLVGTALVACTACSAGRTGTPPRQPAIVALLSDEPDMIVELHARGAPSAGAAPLSCKLPCTLQTTSGPSRVVLRHDAQRDERSIDVAPGPQRIRVRPSDPTLRTLGWVSAGLAVVALGLGVYASTYFTTDGQPAAPGEPPKSAPTWAKATLTASILSVVPLGLASVFLLDRGSASVDVAASNRLAIGWRSAF